MTGSLILDGLLLLFAGYLASVLVCCGIVGAAWITVKVRQGMV